MGRRRVAPEFFWGTVFVEDLARVLINPEGWRLHLARLCEVRGWMPSPSLACWEGDLELKHSAPGSDAGARANSGQDAFFGCRFAPEKSPPQDQSGRAGGLTRRVCVKLEVGSPQQVWRAGRETLKSSTQRQVPTLGLEPTSGQGVFFWAPIRLRKQPSARSLRGGWGLYPARWCEARERLYPLSKSGVLGGRP